MFPGRRRCCCVVRSASDDGLSIIFDSFDVVVVAVASCSIGSVKSAKGRERGLRTCNGFECFDDSSPKFELKENGWACLPKTFVKLGIDDVVGSMEDGKMRGSRWRWEDDDNADVVCAALVDKKESCCNDGGSDGRGTSAIAWEGLGGVWKV